MVEALVLCIHAMHVAFGYSLIG